MQINFQDVKVLCGSVKVTCNSIENLSYKPLNLFNAQLCDFLNEVSALLLHTPEAKQYPDIVTFAFFCRKANINKLLEYYRGRIENSVGRGLTFHVAPSNVPINFAYTLVAGLLAGNACIVKASSKGFAQTNILCGAFSRILKKEEFSSLKPYVNVVEYSRDNQEVTEYFSSMCNARIIWGGDETISSVRKAPLPPRAFDVTFTDRYSLCVINASELLNADLKQLAQDFYNDTYLYDQNACSSPRLIYWLGDEVTVKKAQSAFWDAVYNNIKDRYPVESIIAIDKYMTACRTAITLDGTKIAEAKDNRISRILIKELESSIVDLRSAGGSFLEYISESLDDLAPIVNEKYQTLSYYGLKADRIKEFVVDHGLKGIDRIVPIGKTADFGFIWDGYDLIKTLSREILAV